MNQIELVSLLTLIIGIILAVVSGLLYWLKNKKDSKIIKSNHDGNIFMFLRRYFWIVLFAVGIMCVIAGIVGLI